MEFFINNLYTVILFPLWIFLLIVLGRFFCLVQSKKIITYMTLASTLYGFVFALGSFIYILHTPDFVYENSYPFLRIEDFALNFGVMVDNLSVLMLLVVTVISFIVQLYSSSYMHNDKSFPRFFGYLNFFNFSMIGLVLSPNLFQNYIFWELVGISSYLLIGFWYKKNSASKAAKKAFLMNRIGDCGLLVGTIAVSYFMFQYTNIAAFTTVPFANISDVANYLYSYTSEPIFNIICILLLMGSIAKSAQFPLHTWLADAMEGPTPVSALIHSATMVAAGVYLIARLYPIYMLSELTMNIIAIVGLVTALMCAYFAISQYDLKKILAYSTSSQLGLMFLALGAGAYTGGVFHLVTHACFKSMLFLCAGIIMHSLSDQQDVRFMGGLRKYMPLNAICYLIGCFSISGLLFSGFYSKEMILSSMLKTNHFMLSIGFLLVAFMTAFYMFRSYFLVFEGNYKGEKEPEKPGLILNISILVLAVLTVVLGPIVNGGVEKFLQYGSIIPQNLKMVNPQFVSLAVAFVGFLFALVFYNTKVKTIKIPVFYQLSYNRFYIDNFYNFLSEKVYSFISKVCAFIDKYIVDGLVVLAGLNVRAFSWTFAKMQTGNFQSYLAYSLVFLAMIFAGLMFAYSAIVNFGLLSGGS